MPDNSDCGFFVQLYEDVEGVAIYTGIVFESGVLGEEVPRVGDCIISPLRKAAIAGRGIALLRWSARICKTAIGHGKDPFPR